MENLAILFLLFVIYSFLGWVMEVIVVLPKEKKFVNRGFLIGPWCPIYGTGTVLMILLLDKYKQDIPALFVMATVVCSILEYLTSYVMEKVFNARWWDYSDRKFNLEGRICLSNAMAFGILGFLVVKIITPALLTVINKMSLNAIYITAGIFWLVMFIDFILACVAMFKFKNVTFELKKDNTREITEKVKEAFIKKSYIYKHLIEAFPNVHETLVLKKEEIDKKIEEARIKLEEKHNLRIEEIKKSKIYKKIKERKEKRKIRKAKLEAKINQIRFKKK